METNPTNYGLFPIVSVKLLLSLSVTARSICLQFGDFYLSLLLSIALVASVSLSPVLICCAYLIFLCIIMVPYSRLIFSILKQWLEFIPTIFISCTTKSRVLQPHHSPELVVQVNLSDDDGDLYVGED